MATVEEVLADTSQLDYLDDDIQYVIDEDLRTIMIPSDGVILGVQGDKNINRVNFQMPRYYNGFDMSEFDVRVNYKNANGDKNFYIVKDATVRGDMIYFTWLVDPYATAYIGMVQFVVRLFKLDEENGDHIFYTTHNSAEVLEGLMVDEQLTEEEYSDWSSKLQQEILEAMKSKLDEYSLKIEDYVNGLQSNIDDLIKPAINNYITNNNIGVKYAVGEWTPLPLSESGSPLDVSRWDLKGVYVRVENLVFIEGWMYVAGNEITNFAAIGDLPFSKSFMEETVFLRSNLSIKDRDRGEIDYRFLGNDKKIQFTSAIGDTMPQINIHISGCYTSNEDFESKYNSTNLSTPTLTIDSFTGVEFVEGESKTITLTEVVE